MTPLDYRTPERSEPADHRPGRGLFALGALLLGVLLFFFAVNVNIENDSVGITFDILILLSMATAFLASLLAVVRIDSRTRLAWWVFALSTLFWAIAAAGLIQDLIH